MIFMRLAKAGLDTLYNIENEWSLDRVVYAHIDMDRDLELEREAHKISQEKM